MTTTTMMMTIATVIAIECRDPISKLVIDY